MILFQCYLSEKFAVIGKGGKVFHENMVLCIATTLWNNNNNSFLQSCNLLSQTQCFSKKTQHAAAAGVRTVDQFMQKLISYQRDQLPRLTGYYGHLSHCACEVRISCSILFHTLYLKHCCQRLLPLSFQTFLHLALVSLLLRRHFLAIWKRHL